jgi:hypothetical protein
LRRDLGGALRILAAPTLALLAISAFVPGRLTLAARIYALIVCAVALGLVLGTLRRTYPRARPLRPRPVGKPGSRRPPPSLARIEHETALGVAGAFDLHFRLVPRVRAIAAGLLASRRRVALDTAPDAARRILGPETWELVRGDRQPPDDRLARGLPVSELRRVVESLESV